MLLDELPEKLEAGDLVASATPLGLYPDNTKTTLVYGTVSGRF